MIILQAHVIVKTTFLELLVNGQDVKIIVLIKEFVIYLLEFVHVTLVMRDKTVV